jgi:putative endonuclease
MPHVYILECGDGSYYVGSARHLELRLAEHQAGTGGAYTSKRQPVALVFSESFDRVDDAYERENRFRDGAARSAERSSRGDSVICPA